MNNIGSTINNKPCRKNVIDEHFERNAGVRIHKGKECYGGGSGYYAAKAKPNCPNVNDGRASVSGQERKMNNE